MECQTFSISFFSFSCFSGLLPALLLSDFPGWLRHLRRSRLGRTRTTATIKINRRPVQENTRWVQAQGTGAGSEGQFHAGVDEKTATGFEVDFLTSLVMDVGARLEVQSCIDSEGVVPVDSSAALAFDGAMLGALNSAETVTADAALGMTVDRGRCITGDVQFQIPVAVHRDFLLSAGILQH